MPTFRVKWFARVKGVVVVDAPDAETAWQLVADGRADLESDSDYDDIEVGDVEREEQEK